MTKLPFPRFFLMFFLFFLPSLEMSHGAQISQEVIQLVEPATAASRSVGSGDWIGPSLFFMSNGAQKIINPIADHSVAVWRNISGMDSINPFVVGPSLVRSGPTEEWKGISVGEKQSPNFPVGGFIHSNATDGRINLNNFYALHINQLGAESVTSGNPSGVQIQRGGGGSAKKSADETRKEVQCGCGCCGYDLGYHIKRMFFFLIGAILGVATALGIAWWMFRPTPIRHNFK